MDLKTFLNFGHVSNASLATIHLISSNDSYSIEVKLNIMFDRVNLVEGCIMCDHMDHVYT